jgi:acyl-[acyl-carrier-protein]-phospholipid O-acyltransferase / long-chain-fatty-acid--[acyl-carrier-protein] ligase
MVGLLLPPSVPGALVNFAAMLLGKVPVNLNYTVSEQTLASCIRQCDIKTVVTSKAFLEKVKLKVPARRFSGGTRGASRAPGKSSRVSWRGCCRPAGWSGRWGAEKKNPLDDLATVIFSSGSTGEPKGVMLSHYNIGSNIEQMEQSVRPGHRDRILGVLPFFHSFGFTGTLCLPAVLGVGVGVSPQSRSMPKPLARWSATTK